MTNPLLSMCLVGGEFSEIAEFACTLATEAALCTTSHFRKPLDVHVKADQSPVTIADQKTERLIRDMIAATYPAHGLLGEEHGIEGRDNDEIWVIDPIDGTKSFISGLPQYGTLIAYLKDREVRVGAISMPELKEFWIGIDGDGCFFNGVRCSVSKCDQLAEAILMTTSVEYLSEKHQSRFAALTRQARVRRYGGDCYIYAMVASGWADVAVDTGLQYYDYMAVIPIIEEAGGVITDWSGRRPGLNSDGTILAAATPALHRQALELLTR
ncbi:histidinol-phosphatase [Sneathiella sp.]|uniref:histidinol-phosphatase n=1 Tax=Sneathiella sp. TaxID=1964365 RepID=UPI0035621C53